MREVSVYEQALRLLEFRPRATAELRRRLLQKGGAAVEVEQAIARLTEQRLLDDAVFAQEFARARLTGPGRATSRWRVLQELARKGVPRAVADAAIETLRDEEGVDPSASVHRAAEKKWRTLATLDDQTRRRRLYAFLARRGFDPEEIRAAMQALGAEENA